MAKYTDDLILRESVYSPLTTKGTPLDKADFDDNFINVYKDLETLSFTEGVDAYNAGTTYDDTTVQFATYGGKSWQWINASPGSGVTPADGIYWQEVFPAIMAHRRNSDTILAEGTADECTAADIRAFIDAGLTSTTDLSITTKTSETFQLNSSTGADVTIPAATQTYAGLMSAADKAKCDQLSGENTGDQTLGSLGAEATANKATDFATVNDVLFPTVQAVHTYVSALVREEPYEILLGDTDTDMTVAADIGWLVIPYDIETVEIFAYARTAPTGAALIFDVLIDGVSIFGSGDLLTIDATENSSLTSSAVVTIATVELNKGQILSVDCTQIGSTIAGQNVMFVMVARKRVV